MWVDGRCLMDNRELTTLQLETLCAKAKEWRDVLRESNPYADDGAPDPCSSPFYWVCYHTHGLKIACSILLNGL